ncbi:MAG: TonB-dependent receptor [Alistipes sp.]|nr:TonB-dependent receptor [Rikenellaceae bacterium]MBR1961491.1 TonB-dependent receptor [Alistipes sp.]
MKRIINSVIYASFCIVALLFAQTAMAQKARTITGQVFDNTGQPMIGATVVVVGKTGVGTTTDMQGKYKIKATQDDQLSFSFLGYVEVTERVGNRTNINIVLQQENVSINEVVVIGYGTQQKSDLTGAVTSVNMEDLASTASASVDEALQGRLAGVEIMTTDGEPGSAASIRVRGSRSITASNEPLIVVDGVMDAVSNFSDIDPSEIKNVTVLKDASSTAIYGSRGANGVILVTTHEAKANKLNVTFKATFQLSELPRELDMMNAAEFAIYRNDYFTNSSGTYRLQARSSNYLKYANPTAYGEGTDWIDVMTRRAFSHNYFLSLAGGSKSTKVYFSMSYNDRQGIVINSGQQYLAGRLKIDHTVFKWLKLGINTQYSLRHNDKTNNAISGTSTTAVTNLNPMNTPTSSWNLLGDNGTNGGSIYDSPYLKALNIINESDRTILTLTPYIELTLAKGLRFKTQFSFVHTNTQNFYYSPSTMPVAERYHYGGTATRSSNDNRNLLSENTLSYKKTFKKKHKLDVVAGFTAQNRRTNYVYANARGYLDDNVTAYNMGSLVDKRNLTETTTATELQRYSVLARANYSYGGRYHLTITGRGDASSNFAEGHKWAFFPAAAFKWTISNEKFMRGTKSWLSDLSLRLSAGRSGNDAVSTYVSQMVLTTNQSGWLFGEAREVAYYPTRIDNPNLTWEKTDSFNIGVDFSILNDRITMSLEGYMAYTKDLLYTMQNAAVTGFTTRYANIGNTENKGVEFTFTSRNISRRNFQWTTNLTVAHNSSKVTDIATAYGYVSTYSRGGYMIYGYAEGYPANSLWGFQYEGVWHTQDEIEQNKQTKTYVGYSKSRGYARYADINHDGVLNDKDRIYLGSADPIIYGGFNNTFKIIRNLSLGVYFTYSLGGRMYNIMEFTTMVGSATSNKDRRMLEAWHAGRNPFSNLPGAYLSDSYGSDLYIYDASYLRLQNINLSYRFDLRKKTRYLRDITLTASVNNVALLTKFTGYDPDAVSSGRRIDTGRYPKNRNYSLAIQIRY